MTDPYDPYRQGSGNPYGQQGQPGQPPYGGQQGQPYGGQPGHPYGQPGQPGQPAQPYGQPGAYPGQQPPYQPGQPYQGSYGAPPPDATRQFDPYGADPYAAQQPYQGTYGQPAGWGATPGGPGGYPPGPPRKSKLPMVLISVLAVVILVGGAVAIALVVRGEEDPVAGPTTSAAPATDQTTTTRPTTSEPTTTAPGGDDFEVGQCATLTPEANNRATIRVTECGGALSDVVIAKIESAECVEPYLSFDPGQGKIYCLAMDAKEGDCFRLDNLIKRALACVGDDARKVVKIYDGVADDAQCGAVPETIDVYAYPEPARTLCLGKADL